MTKWARILGELDRLGLRGNTVVLVSSDHGDMLGSHGMRLKRKPWEESIRVPGIVRCPETAPGRASDALFSHVDIAPTLLSLCGLDAPADMQGADLSPVIRGEAESGPESVYFQIFGPFHAGGVEFGWRGVRTERYMYARKKNEPWVLYDLQADPHQLDNLAADPAAAAIRAELEAKIAAWMEKVGDSWDYDWTAPLEDDGRLYKHETFYTVEEFMEWAQSTPTWRISSRFPRHGKTRNRTRGSRRGSGRRRPPPPRACRRRGQGGQHFRSLPGRRAQSGGRLRHRPDGVFDGRGDSRRRRRSRPRRFSQCFSPRAGRVRFRRRPPRLVREAHRPEACRRAGHEPGRGSGGRVLQMGFHHRFSAEHNCVKTLLDAGLLGSVHAFNGVVSEPFEVIPGGLGNYRFNAKQGGGFTLIDVGQHRIDETRAPARRRCRSPMSRWRPFWKRTAWTTA